MTYILILYMLSSGVATTAEYSSQDTCVAAGKAAAAEFGGFSSPVQYICTKK